jgi:hypothetical protein
VSQVSQYLKVSELNIFDLFKREGFALPRRALGLFPCVGLMNIDKLLEIRQHVQHLQWIWLSNGETRDRSRYIDALSGLSLKLVQNRNSEESVAVDNIH